jgi:two-component system NtrC family sensor kinase
LSHSPWARRLPGWPLLLLLALSAAVPLGLFAWHAKAERLRVLEEARLSATRTVAALHEHAAKVFETHELVLAEVMRLVEDRDWDEIERDRRLWLRLTRIVRDLDQLRGIMLVDGTGRVRMTTGAFPPPRDSDVSARGFFRSQRQPGNGLHVGFARPQEGTGERLISLSRRLDSTDGGFDGVVQLSMPVAHLEQFWARFAPGMAHVIPLVRSDGRVIARYPAPHAPEFLSREGPFLRRALAERDGIYTAMSAVDGVERLNAFTRIKDYPLHLSFSLETRAVLAEWRERIAILGLFTFLAVAALLGLSVMALLQFREQRAAALRWQAAAERLAAEMAARERAEAALRRAQTLDALGQLTAGVAHDFNNLLQAIKSGLHLLAPKVPERSRRVLEASQQAVDRGAKLVRQLMVFARREKLEPRPADLRALVAGMGDLLQKAAGKNIAIQADVPAELDPVLVDTTQAELAVLNLVVNARDAMPGGGIITLSARNAPVPRGDAALGLAPGDYVVLAVADTGTGMAPEVLARVLEPFFTTKPVGKGTGLGLSMVHGFVGQSGGGLRIESAPGEGTVVSLFLPRAAGLPAASAALAAEADCPGGPGLTVLLVDDDALGRLATAAALREHGHVVHEARDGAEALLVLAREPGIAAVVTDYAMPGMDGAALAQAALRIRPGLPVVMVTGYAAGTLEGPPPGVFAVLRKPFRLEELDAALRAALAPARRRATEAELVG